MADPAPFSDDDFEWFKEVLAFDGPNVSVGVARRLVATVEQARRERDEAIAALWEANDAFDECTGDYAKALVATESWRFVRRPAEVDAIRQARATTGETSHE